MLIKIHNLWYCIVKHKYQLCSVIHRGDQGKTKPVQPRDHFTF